MCITMNTYLHMYITIYNAIRASRYNTCITMNAIVMYATSLVAFPVSSLLSSDPV